LNTLQKEIAWQSETRKENAMTLHGAESLFWSSQCSYYIQEL
jgi:hypothetical protein